MNDWLIDQIVAVDRLISCSIGLVERVICRLMHKSPSSICQYEFFPPETYMFISENIHFTSSLFTHSLIESFILDHLES